MENNNKPRVLVLTSVDPHVGPAVVAYNFYKALLHGGYEVDFLSPYPVEGHPEFLSVYEGKNNCKYLWKRFRSKVKHFLHPVDPDHCFFYDKETEPPMPVKDVLAAISKPYDVVYVLFWQGMLSFETIRGIHRKLKCQIHFRCVDYSPMAGGCHFVGDCEGYKTGCGNCPGFKYSRQKDYSHFNVMYRKEVYEEVKPIVYGNNYMQSFYKKAYLLKDYDRKEQVYPLVNNDFYYQRDMVESRKQFGIEEDKKFVIFFGAQSLDDERKGFKYLLQALQIFASKLSDKEKQDVILLIAGRDIESVKSELPFDYQYIGYVSPDKLPFAYSAASIFVCPSVDDAGPTMVNQSLSCSTPVVAFEMGTALDMVKGHDTGYCAKLLDSEDLSSGIEKFYKMDGEEYLNIRKECRKIALEYTSEEAFCKNFQRVYEKYRKVSCLEC